MLATRRAPHSLPSLNGREVEGGWRGEGGREQQEGERGPTCVTLSCWNVARIVFNQYVFVYVRMCVCV